MLFDNKKIDMNLLNRIYTKTASAPLETIESRASVGFKMRLRYPYERLSYLQSAPRVHAHLENYWNTFLRRRYRKFIVSILKQNSVVVFVAVRCDILRWALSKYHGDGTGKGGHLQFRLANGKIDRESIPTIQVDCDRLEAVIKRCYKLIEEKRSLMRELQQRNVEVYPIFYEDFNQDKRAFLRDMLAKLDVSANTSEIDMCIEKGTRLKKVHSDDISSFVENSDEVLKRFPNCFYHWTPVGQKESE